MCNCGKNSTPPSGMGKARNQQAADAAERAKAVAAARAANPSTRTIGTQSTVSQTFSLGDGLTFGSALERDAYLARNGR